MQGPAGAQGPKGDTGARGDPGQDGADGLGLSDDQTLPSGETLVGTFSATSPKSAGTEQLVAADLSFRPKLGAAIPEGNIHYVDGGPTDACPGSAAYPAAAAGHLCIYRTAAPNMVYVGTFPIDDNAGDGASARGAIVFFESDDSNTVDLDPRVWGVWAVTAP